MLGTRFWVQGQGSQCWVLGSGFRDWVLSAGVLLFIAFVVRVAPKPLYLSFDYLSQLSVSGLSFYAGVSTGCMKRMYFCLQLFMQWIFVTCKRCEIKKMKKRRAVNEDKRTRGGR